MTSDMMSSDAMTSDMMNSGMMSSSMMSSGMMSSDMMSSDAAKPHDDYYVPYNSKYDPANLFDFSHSYHDTHEQMGSGMMSSGMMSSNMMSSSMMSSNMMSSNMMSSDAAKPTNDDSHYYPYGYNNHDKDNDMSSVDMGSDGMEKEVT